MGAEEKLVIKAEIRQVRENAGAFWWQNFVQSQATAINRRMSQHGVIYWVPSENMPLDLFSYIREAGSCFDVARFLATIVLASGVVEIILNRDSRTKAIKLDRFGDGWAKLNKQNLSVAGSAGLPVNVLLDSGESLLAQNPIRFIERRNKVAHGEILHLIRTLSDYDPVAENEASDQFMKAQRFLVEWFNTAADVQESRIRKHRWPEV